MQKSIAQHHATAMLLGMEYSEMLNCYCKRNGPAPDTWIDADTMQELTATEKFKRLQGAINDQDKSFP